MKLGPAEKSIILLALALLVIFAVYTVITAAAAPELEISAAQFPVPEREYNILNTSDALININTADSEELARLPGVGTVLAERIVQYREEHGLFSFPEDILNVSGIGEAKYENMADMITVSG